jgi:hypothetical protein
MHRQTPDIDNLLKGLMDAIFEEDCRVASVWIEKRWADRGKITIQEGAFPIEGSECHCCARRRTLQELIETAKAAI